MSAKRPKLVLIVVDAMKATTLDRVIEAGDAPFFAEVARRGTYIRDCVSVFPSVTPVAASAITCGVASDKHGVPGMNWYSRDEDRYIEYGSSIAATQVFGIKRSFIDVAIELNATHLSKNVTTIIEDLDDAGIRTALTTYLIYRGRHKHAVSPRGALGRLTAAILRSDVLGPKEIFYGDLFSSRTTSCRSTLSLPGARDKQSGCIGDFLVRNDLFDFLLLSMPDNDFFMHRRGPDFETGIIKADEQICRVADAAGGIDQFLDSYAVIVCSDHAQNAVKSTIELFAPLSDFGIRSSRAKRKQTQSDRIAVCPGGRAAQIYLLDQSDRQLIDDVVERARLIKGVDLTVWREGKSTIKVVSASGAKLSFSPVAFAGSLDKRGHRWRVVGDLETLKLIRDGDRLYSDVYPDAFGRLWSALECERSGDVLLSAEMGYEFLDWGGAVHTAGAHGSLIADDSNAVLMWSGVNAEVSDRDLWSITDIKSLISDYYKLS